MASNDVSLVEEVTALLEKFRESGPCLESFMENASGQLKDVDPQQRKFILDAVCGCVEHDKMLDVVIRAFYDQHGDSSVQTDRTLFVIVCYLTTFALDDLGFQYYSSIVKSLGIKKMHTFLSFFFSHLTKWIQQEWSSIYDADFVQTEWIEPLLREVEWRPEINILMDQLAVQLPGVFQLTKAPPQSPGSEELSLTKHKKQRPTMYKLTYQQEKPKAAPQSLYRVPKEMLTLDEIKRRNLQAAQGRLFEANEKQPRSANPNKSERTKRLMSQIEEDFRSKLKFDSVYSSGHPPSKKKSPLKLNKTAILRSEAVTERQLEEELQRVEQLLWGAGEPSSFLQWQKEMHDKDLTEKLHEMEDGRMAARISHRKAAQARRLLAEQRHREARVIKEETAQLMQSYAEKRLKEEKTMTCLVKQVAEGHKNSRVAREKLQKFKQRVVKEVSEQNQELLRQALDKAQADLCQRFQTIQEIHSIESISPNRVKMFDDTEPAGHWVLGEMSLFELKTRLAVLKEAREKELEKKRRLILEEKQQDKMLQQEKRQTFSVQQMALAKAAATRTEERKAREEACKQAVAQDETLLAKKRQLEELKQEHRRWKQIERSKYRPSKHRAQEHRGTQKQSVPVRSWDEIVEGLTHCLESQQIHSSQSG